MSAQRPTSPVSRSPQLRSSTLAQHSVPKDPPWTGQVGPGAFPGSAPQYHVLCPTQHRFPQDPYWTVQSDPGHLWQILNPSQLVAARQLIRELRRPPWSPVSHRWPRGIHRNSGPTTGNPETKEFQRVHAIKTEGRTSTYVGSGTDIKYSAANFTTPTLPTPPSECASGIRTSQRTAGTITQERG